MGGGELKDLRPSTTLSLTREIIFADIEVNGKRGEPLMNKSSAIDEKAGFFKSDLKSHQRDDLRRKRSLAHMKRWNVEEVDEILSAIPRAILERDEMSWVEVGERE